jgi:hypothetical protein
MRTPTVNTDQAPVRHKPQGVSQITCAAGGMPHHTRERKKRGPPGQKERERKRKRDRDRERDGGGGGRGPED